MDNHQSKGGKATAASMTAEQRSERARKAALAKAEAAAIPKATHGGTLKIGDAEIPCYVLPDGTRVLSQGGFLSALGRADKARGTGGSKKVLEGGGDNLPSFLAANNLKPFISNELAEATTPVLFRTPSTGDKPSNKAYGFRAELLPRVCRVYLEARDAGKLLPSQSHLSAAADILVRGFAEVGINSLVDEATGYQEVRDKQAMQNILDKFLRKELAVWAKRFPDEFYRQIFRLKGWEYKPESVKRPGVIGYYTKDIVYARLAPGVLKELESLNPSENGRRKVKHHQWLSETVGDVRLAEVIGSVVMAMKLSATWDQFRRILDATMPRHGDTLPLVFEAEDYAIEREELLQPQQLSDGSQS